MTVAGLTLDQARDKMRVRQEELSKVFAEAKNDDGKYDFNKVTCLGGEVKGSIAVAEKVNQMNAELNELGEHVDTLDGAEKAAREHEGREKGRRGFPFPGQRGEEKGSRRQVKSLGEWLAEEKAYQNWAKAGAGGGVTLQFDEAWPSDILAKAAQFDTMGAKALFETSAGYAPQSLRIGGFVEAATRPIQLLDIIPVAQTGYESVVYMEETTRTHAAAEKAEGGTYAESAFAFTEKNSPVVKITDSLPVTDEQLKDAAMMESYVNGRLLFGIRQRLDTQVLIGNGTAPNLRGLKNVSGIQTQARGADPVPDTIYKAMTKIRVIGRAIPTHVLLHPDDWQGVRLMRTADGVYVWGNPSEAGPERIWGQPVVQQDIDSAGTGYVGSFQPSWVSLFERQGIEMQVGYTGTQFVEGKRTVRGDMRAALAWFRPAAFCETTGL